MVAENDGRKRMGENIGRPFVIGNGDEGREGTDRRILPVYSIGGTTYQSSNITRMCWPDGRYSMAESSIE